jgi:hypothetical protein
MGRRDKQTTPKTSKANKANKTSKANKAHKAHKVNKTSKANTANKANKTQRTFQSKDFHSGDGFMTAIWGPPQWHMLHTISFNYPVEPTDTQKRMYRDYLLSLQHVLPCRHCRENMTKNLKQLPLREADMASRDTFSRYVYELHEIVNNMLNKSSNLSYEDVRERYEHFRSRCTKDLERGDLKEEVVTKVAKAAELGCVTPLYGAKSRCILSIVPQTHHGASIQIDQKCIRTRAGAATRRNPKGAKSRNSSKFKPRKSRSSGREQAYKTH